MDFGLQAHLHSPKFPLAKDEATVRQRVANCPYVVYALDDAMAIKVDDVVVELVGEGKSLKFEPGVRS